jgi:uncharacterized protein YecT (DUF1311 family)
VRGPSLRQVLDVAGTLPVARATEVLRGLGRALVWAHSSQIMHRDVRPENVIFEDRTGRVVLSDFGLARRLEATPSEIATGAEAYRAPELTDGRYPDRRTDVYSLGIVGWELLTGRRPWPDTMEPIEPGQRAPAPPPLAEVRPGLPPALVAALEGAVQLDRDRRITDVTTFIERLTNVAPPAPEPEEEPIEETPFAAAPTEWVAMPVPPMPRKPAPAGGDREVPREAAREIGGDAARLAGSEPAVSAAAKTEPGVERPVERDVEREARPAPAESFAPPPAQELQPPTSASVEAAAPAQLPASTTLPPHVPADAKRRRPKKGAAFRDAPVTEPGKATTPVTEERRAESALGSAAAASPAVDAPRPDRAVSKPPPIGPGAAKPPAHVPSDVELPPPEPVPFADMPSEPLRGPISGPARGKARGATRFESMRGGLGTPRRPTERPRGHEASGGPPAPQPLQPMWDTPAELPLPVMPDPRPMPADAAGGDGPTRRQWTPRGIAVAVVAVLLAAAAVTLARMERTPDTTAKLMQPENPTGYGGDVVLTPRTGDSVASAPRAVVRPGAAATGAAGARRSRDVAAPAAPAASQPAAPPPAARPSASAGQPAGRAGSATPPTRGATTAVRPPAATPAARPPAATPAASPARTAERPAGNGPCNSPALADQRACLTAAIERSDAALNQVYGDVVAAMRERASTAPGDPDPPEVQRLRAVQRSWVAERDAECRRRGRGREGPLWATPRAQCLEQFSTNRSQELSAMLARLRRD